MLITPSSGLRKQDLHSVFGGVCKDKAGRDMAWQFVNTEWEKIVEM